MRGERRTILPRKYDASALWAYNTAANVTREAVRDLGSFKSSDVNFKLALWNPRTNGVRYLKELVYTLAGGLDEVNWRRLRNIGHRDVGHPFAVRYNGMTVCLDYLQAVHELGFIGRALNLDGGSILEIGAGYGRTCHAILSNHDVAAYHIIDLDNCLDLSAAYLAQVLPPEEFRKVTFVRVPDIDDIINGQHFDLCVNIDSFAEMDPETVGNYLRMISRHCDHFYVNNPVGKYLDKTLDDHVQGEEVVALALKTGLLRDVIDIYDNLAVAAEVPKFLAAYRPGPEWSCVVDGPAIPWSHYWQAVFRADPAAEERTS
jgi:putative sugar O-methyltransferase